MMKQIMKRAWEIYRELIGDKIAKLSMALRQAWAEAKAAAAKKMNGTEKQIKWAEDIKARFNEEFAAKNTFGKKMTGFVLETIMPTFTDAKWWIENRVVLNTIMTCGDVKKAGVELNKIFAQAVEINPALAQYKK